MVYVDEGLASNGEVYFEQAAEHLKNVVDVFPRFADAQYWMGFCHFRMGNYPASVRYLERVVSLGEARLEVHELVAKSYEKLGDHGKSIERLLVAARAFPDSGGVHYNLGVLYHRVGNKEAAVRHIDRALTLEPGAPWAGFARQLQRQLKNL